MHAAYGGEREGEGATGDTTDPGRGLRPLHPLASVLRGDTTDPGRGLAALCTPAHFTAAGQRDPGRLEMPGRVHHGLQRGSLVVHRTSMYIAAYHYVRPV